MYWNIFWLMKICYFSRCLSRLSCNDSKFSLKPAVPKNVYNHKKCNTTTICNYYYYFRSVTGRRHQMTKLIYSFVQRCVFMIFLLNNRNVSLRFSVYFNFTHHEFSNYSEYYEICSTPWTWYWWPTSNT